MIGECERAALASALAPLADDEVALIHSSSNVDTQFSNFKNFEDDESADVVTNFFSKQTREVTASHSDPETVQIAKYKLFKSILKGNLTFRGRVVMPAGSTIHPKIQFFFKNFKRKIDFLASSHDPRSSIRCASLQSTI